MVDVADEALLVGECRCQFVGCGEVASSVVSHVDDETVARGKFGKHIGEVAAPDAVAETFAADIAYIVFQYLVFQSGSNHVVRAEIKADDAVVVVFGIILAETPVASEIERRTYVDVSVLEFAHHVAKHLEELLLVHIRIDFLAVALVHLVPVNADGLLLVGK